MPVLNQSQKAAIQPFIYGTRVDRATATLPQTTASAIYNVVGGRVLIMGIVGEVTTIIQNQANNTKLVANPTTGSDVDICAVASIANLEVGGLLSVLDFKTATALSKTNAGSAPFAANAGVVAVGTIDLNCAASNTGSVKWSLWYVPLDDGAYVTAA
jgi:hypothetical protein